MRSGFLCFVLILLLSLRHSAGDDWLMPMVELGKVKTMVVADQFFLGGDGGRRRLNGFQVCSPCMCCGGNSKNCLPSPCCYAINCNIPHRPFGFCAFTPITCNCFQCNT